MRPLLSRFGPPAVGAVVAIAGWWAATVVFDIRSFFLPAPPEIVHRFLEQPVFLLKEAQATLLGTLAGLGIAIVAALSLAVLLAAVPIVERATLPLLVVLNSVPKVAIAPLLIVWLGYGPKPKIFLAALICFFPLVVSAMSGFASTPADLTELSRSLRASWWQTYLKIRIPWALPQIFVGFKVAISLAPVGAVVAEVYNPDHGLGAVVALSSTSADTPLAFAAITLLAVISVALYYVVVAVERLVLPWAREISG
ncbi:ABC transporter permease [Winogradskya humida]|uniref:ABC transporter permease n=1 Tax=Winogradskya humida TaxID=113566 RepID=A0ABQ3ZXM3_9ACTN|nr:ABC transporter permease [Actinoplanes humidus]GIE23309.1 ABC transporter permease [Actinoplanes humidus]